MKLKLLLLSLLLPFSAFGANTNAFDNVLIKNALQLRMGSPAAGKFWISSDSIGYGAWGLNASSLTNYQSANLVGPIPYSILPIGTATNITGSDGIVATQPTPGTWNLSGSGIATGGNVFTTSNNTYTVASTNTFNGTSIFSNILFNTTFNAGLATNLQASSLVGTILYARLPTGTATNVTGSGGIAITQPTAGTWNVDGSGISGGGSTNTITFGFRSGHIGASAYTFNTVTNLTTSRTNGTVIARAQFMTVAGAQLVVFARIYGGGMTNIACFTQAAAQSNPIAGHVVLANIITNNTTYTFDVWASSASLGYTNNVSAGATYPAMQNQLGMTLVEHP